MAIEFEIVKGNKFYLNLLRIVKRGNKHGNKGEGTLFLRTIRHVQK